MSIGLTLGLLAIGIIGGNLAGVLIYEGCRWAWLKVRGAE